MSAATPLDHVDSDADDISCTHSDDSAPFVSQTDITSSSLSSRPEQSGDHMIVLGLEQVDCSPVNSNANMFVPQATSLYERVLKQDDIVAQNLAQRVVIVGSMEALQATDSDYGNTYAGRYLQGLPYRTQHESYASRQSQQRWYPDPESIRHLHTLHSLLPHLQPERKLNALNGSELDIIDGHTGNIICHAVPKKMLILFLGREVVSKFLHTIECEHDGTWSDQPTRQVMILPHRSSSSAALRILISWMIRACKFATMYAMKQIRLPVHLFAACSLAQTMETLGLHRDAYRIDMAISQQFLKRPIYAVEVETLWRCLGERSKYVYGATKAASGQLQTSSMEEEFKGLAERYPRLYARIRDPDLNERYRPHFGREWFKRLGHGAAEHLQRGELEDKETSLCQTEVLSVLGHCPGNTITDVVASQGKTLDPSAPEFTPMASGIEGLKTEKQN